MSWKSATEALNNLVRQAERNLAEAIKNEDWSRAATLEAYKNGLEVAQGVLRGSSEETRRKEQPNGQYGIL